MSPDSNRIWLPNALGAVALLALLRCAPASQAVLPAQATTRPAVSGASTVVPTPVVEERAGATQVDLAAWTLRLQQFYAGMSGDAVARKAAYHSFFAPKVRRFIGLMDVTREQAIAAAERFLAMRRNVTYSLLGLPSVVSTGAQEQAASAVATRLTYTVQVRWTLPVPAAWRERVSELDDATIDTDKQLTVELEANAGGEVTAYRERDSANLPHVTVVVPTRGYEIPWSPCWKTVGDELSSVELPLGTKLTSTGESVGSLGCGPASRILGLRFEGRTIWALEALYELVPNPNGGSSLGGTEFFERTP